MMSRVSSLALLLFALAPALFAKGVPELVVITGPTAREPIEIKNPAELQRLSPWAGRFVDWQQPVVESPACGAEYDVRIFMRWKERHSAYDRGPLRLVYGFGYCRNAQGGAGFIFLPGRNDRYGPENMSTMLRTGRDGRWQHASAEWETLMRERLNAR